MSFGDIRVAERADWLIERVATAGTLVLRKLGETRAGEKAVHRFLSSPYVSVDRIVETLAARTAQQCVGCRVLAVQDTTEINFAGRDKKRRGFGPAGDGKTPGFFIHPVVAIDVACEAMVGLVDAEIWTRSADRVTSRRSRAIEDKESARWLSGCQAAASVLSEAAEVTMVADREGDIYLLFARKPKRLHLIVRSGQDRSLANEGSLFTALAAAQPLGSRTVQVAPRGPGDKGRKAIVELYAGGVRIARPPNMRRSEAPDEVELTLVEVREIDAPPGKTPILWRLLTTHSVACVADAEDIVRLYRLRWRIEQTFRALKSDGLALDDSQLADAERMFNLAAIGLAGAIRTIQLVDARDGGPRPASDVIDTNFTTALERLSKKLEGKTSRQKNPHPSDSLAFISWIAARLGGWNCYYKPPGPKTMRDGWSRLAATLEGYALATQEQNPGIP
ncbi:IS4 family transposase [Bradyrhizobium liaoningense]|uniref:IS4 family transposase n=1 Tax=Bradyrhizobium liaoningense TaxID=43992 RepID=UPI001BA5287F|nr:IS4 family transposase [Bradyrhizobium liaoningense]MBR0716225.1 IS4 family transposase [Bradyrhizobium liaoningense]